jgi:HAD superfamily hydrolase (TIGR01509 family)
VTKTNGIRALVFDCDGVLFDTTRANSAYYNRILAHLGHPPLTPEQFGFCHMHTVDRSLEFLFAPHRQVAEAQEFRRRMGYRPFVPLMVPEPTLRPLLARLGPAVRTAVATNRTDTMAAVLETHGLSGAFDLVVTSADVVRPKPAPDMLLKVLETFGLTPDEALYVGDSEVDQDAAEAAGMRLVAYGNRRLRAAWHVERLAELEALLDRAD